MEDYYVNLIAIRSFNRFGFIFDEGLYLRHFAPSGMEMGCFLTALSCSNDGLSSDIVFLFGTEIRPPWNRMSAGKIGEKKEL